MGIINLLLSLSFLLFTSNALHDFDPTRVAHLSWYPRAFLYKGFLSHQECDHLISLAKDKLERSTVAELGSGRSVMSNVRTSSGMFLLKHQDDIVARIERRIAAWTFLPEENGEPIQVLRYQNGQKYDEHFDVLDDEANLARGGHRVATVLMYLSNVERGGETVFPSAEAVFRAFTREKNESWSDCAKHGYAVKPVKGDALLFYSLHVDATPDPASLHRSCPVVEGEKWSATKWIHVRTFDRRAPRECVNENTQCPQWAAEGECQRNPGYMVGSQGSPGFCRKSCRVCVS